MQYLGFVVLAVAVATGYARSMPCITECPQDCGQKVRDGICLECLCDEPYFPVPPPPPTNPDCPQECPQDCGQTRQPNGCLKCDCTPGPYHPLIKPVRPPPTKNRREADDRQLCSTKCPQDCGCTIDNGEATCHCTAGPNHPLIKPPPPPRPPTKNRREADDRQLCSTKCPQDCGCTIDNGEATCHCTAGPNHPLIKPPPPPRPTKNRREADDRQLCSTKCPQDCGCTIDDGEATCHCTAGPNHPLIKPVRPTPDPSKRDRRETDPNQNITPQPPQDDGTICRHKCPADCGCTLNEAREAQCHCTAENHPLIKKPPPPLPVRPTPTGGSAGENDATICRQKCPADCGCTLNEAREAQCHCTAENHPLIKHPVPLLPPNPSSVHRRHVVTPTTERPMIQCTQPLCDSPCYLASDPRLNTCLICKCDNPETPSTTPSTPNSRK